MVYYSLLSSQVVSFYHSPIYGGVYNYCVTSNTFDSSRVIYSWTYTPESKKNSRRTTSKKGEHRMAVRGVLSQRQEEDCASGVVLKNNNNNKNNNGRSGQTA